MNRLVRVSAIVLALTALPLIAAAQTYTYDNLGRVTEVVQPNGAKTVYYYDNVNNRTATQTVTSGSPSITPPAAGPTYIQVVTTSNLRTLANNAGYAGGTGITYTFTVPCGTTIMGPASSPATAIDTGTWPAGVTLALNICGTVYGGGGNGGNGGLGTSNGDPGTDGGDAIYVRAPMTITVQTGGVVKGAGGGGGGGKGATGAGGTLHFGGGGGGGGFPNGAGGGGAIGDADGLDGADGTTSGGGAGGLGGSTAKNGQAGGNAATVGGSNGSLSGAGGAAGYAIRKNGNAVTVTNNGTITGTVG